MKQKLLMETCKKNLNYFLSKNYLEGINEAKEKIATLHRLWRKFGKDKIVLQMKAVVEEIVQSYQVDFYKYDLELMEKYPYRFIWLVREHGTHLTWLEGDEKSTELNRMWYIEGLSKEFGPDDKVKSTHRLYIVDRSKGEMKEVKTFSELIVELKFFIVTKFITVASANMWIHGFLLFDCFIRSIFNKASPCYNENIIDRKLFVQTTGPMGRNY
jgi:hypothetical protein